jgi:hypothetical protein
MPGKSDSRTSAFSGLRLKTAGIRLKTAGIRLKTAGIQVQNDP